MVQPTQGSPSPTVSYSATGLGYTVCSVPLTGSGLDDVSAVSGGPWEIVTQDLNLEYFRVADCDTGFWESWGLSLSSVPDVSAVINKNFILVKGTASVASRKSYDMHRGSHQQSQTFQVCANNLDNWGRNYGQITTGMFGPQGNIKTTRPYRHRRPWDWAGANTSEVFNETVTFWSYKYDTSTGGNPAEGAEQFWNDPKWWLSWVGSDLFANTGDCNGGRVSQYHGWDPHAGGYSASQEVANPDNACNLINQVAYYLTIGELWLHDGTDSTLMPHYDNNRHDFN